MSIWFFLIGFLIGLNIALFLYLKTMGGEKHGKNKNFDHKRRINNTSNTARRKINNCDT